MKRNGLYDRDLCEAVNQRTLFEEKQKQVVPWSREIFAPAEITLVSRSKALPDKS